MSACDKRLLAMFSNISETGGIDDKFQTTIYYINNVLQGTFLFFCHIIILESTHDKNAALLATETQPTPTSLQGEPQMSKCVIAVVCSNAHIHSVVFGGINNCDIIFFISSVLIKPKHQVTGSVQCTRKCSYSK